MKAPRLFSLTSQAGAARGRSTPGFVAAATLALALLGGPPAARAALVIETAPTPITAPAGGTGSFEVLLRDTGGTFDIAGFSIDLSIPAGTGITFTGADTNTTSAAYIFGTYQSAPAPFASPDFPATTFPASTLNASDVDFSAPSVTLNPGDVVGLADVHFTVAPGTTPGTVVPVSFEGPGTSLSDANGDAVPVTFPAFFTITVTAVPEPSAVLLFGLGSVSTFALIRRRRPAATGADARP